jgi:tetratricopeptide (TPR) repeat protein
VPPSPQAASSAGVDLVDAELRALITEHRKDYSRHDLLRKIVAIGMEHGHFGTVEEHLMSFMQVGVRSLPLLHLIATVQEKKQDYVKAASTLREAFAQREPVPEALYDAAGRVLPRTFALADLEFGRELLETGVKDYPGNLKILMSLFEIYQMLGQHEKILPLCDQAIQRMPGNELLYFTKGLIGMIVSNLTGGFEDYQHRFNMPNFKDDTPSLPWPLWQSEALAGKTLYLWAEQGVGDMVMWAGLMPWLAQQGASVTCAVPAKLLGLFGRSFPGIRFVEKQLTAPLGTFDFHCPMGNLMQYALPHYKPAAHAAHLVPDKDAVARKRAEYLTQRPNAKKLVGISWHTTALSGWRRNISLQTLNPLLQEPDTVYVSLQYNQRLDDVDDYNKQAAAPLVTDLSFVPVGDIDAWATQHAAMDEVLSIQNSSVHLAGALGVPATIFLPSAGSFHWGDAHSPNPWYRSVTVCQQKPGQRWDEVIAAYRASKG